MNIFSFLTLKADTKCLNASSTLRQVIESMDYYKYSVLPLLDDEGHYIGSVSEGDVLRFIKNDCGFDINKAEHVHVNTIAHYRQYKALDIQCNLEDLFKLSLEQNFIPIVDGRNVFIGIIRRATVLNYLKSNVDKAIFED